MRASWRTSRCERGFACSATGSRWRRRRRTNRFEHIADQPGVYRIEAWVEIGGEVRPWIYSNPIYLRGGAGTGAE